MIHSKKDEFLNKIYEESVEDLENFFKLNWKEKKYKPKLILVPDRKTMDELMGRKTEDWVVGLVDGSNVLVLDKDNYESESCHKYSDEEYKALIKHELAHLFTLEITEGATKPRWLFEGIAIFLSGQNKFKERPKKLFRFIEFYDSRGKELYKEPGFAVEFLIMKYGREKLINLLKSLKKTKSENEFRVKFREIYGFELDYKNFRL